MIALILLLVAQDRVPRYGRWAKDFDPSKKIDRVEFTAPDGAVETQPTFSHQAAEMGYEQHGFETLKPVGAQVTQVRFTPTQVGAYRYRARSESTTVEEGEIRCEASTHPGFVEISKADPRYFRLSDGSPFCPIGLNLCWPIRILPADRPQEQRFMGAADYRRWFSELAKNGGNFARLWLSSPYFDAETDRAAELEALRFARLDRVVELAREHGIRLKLCLEHFRSMTPGGRFVKFLKHPESGKSPKDISEWFKEPVWRAYWIRKVRQYTARYGGDPTIAAWELWNEIDACETGDWNLVRDWARDTLREVRALAPRQLVVCSLGSFDHELKKRTYTDFKMPEMDYQEVHRYLDHGANLEICRLDPVAFSIDAIDQARRPDRPVLLSETGAVEDRHGGPFRYYRIDHRGILFHDTTFPAFFSGAAGTGQNWFWDSYVDQKNLWGHFRPFADLVAGIRMDEEGFERKDASTDRAWALALVGKKNILVWIRNKADSWHATLRDGKEPGAVEGLSVDLGARSGRVRTLRPWAETGEATLSEGRLVLPPFRHGMMVRVERE